MIRTLKVLISNATQVEDIEVSVSKNSRFGDYSSNVLLKNRLNVDKVVQKLKDCELFEEISVTSGYLNLTLKSDLMLISAKIEGVNAPKRLLEVFNRLNTEGYDGQTKLLKEWSPLVKQLNLIQTTYELFGSIKTEDLKAVFQMFEKLDFAYVYRVCDEASLTGIKKLLGTILMVIERASDE